MKLEGYCGFIFSSPVLFISTDNTGEVKTSSPFGRNVQRAVCRSGKRTGPSQRGERCQPGTLYGTTSRWPRSRKAQSHSIPNKDPRFLCVQERSEKTAKRLQLMTKRCEALEKRRAMEAEGFKSDLKILKQRFKDIEKQLFKVKKASAWLIVWANNYSYSPTLTFTAVHTADTTLVCDCFRLL